MDWSINGTSTQNNAAERGTTDPAASGNASVTRMSDIRNRTRYAALAQIDAYWTGLRGNRLMPQRSEIDPRGLKGCLEYCFVLERIAPGLARMRVAGSHLGDLMGMEVRGMPISSFLTPDSRDPFGQALEEVFETPCTATIELSSETGLGRPALAGRMILMPVRSDLGDVSRILGGFVTDGEIGRSPRRFTVDHISLTPIKGVDTTPRAGRPPLARDMFVDAESRAPRAPQTRDRAPAGFAEKAPEFEQPLPGVPYLRVVK